MYLVFLCCHCNDFRHYLMVLRTEIFYSAFLCQSSWVKYHVKNLSSRPPVDPLSLNLVLVDCVWNGEHKALIPRSVHDQGINKMSVTSGFSLEQSLICRFCRCINIKIAQHLTNSSPLGSKFVKLNWFTSLSLCCWSKCRCCFLNVRQTALWHCRLICTNPKRLIVVLNVVCITKII